MSEITITNQRISSQEYIEFLSRSDLGSQYPQERFESRIEKLVANTDISLIARNENSTIVGVCFGISDFSYWLFITDISVDRHYTKQGIGKRLLRQAHELAGGSDDIILYLCAKPSAVPFYEKLGLKKSRDIMELNTVQWTSFTVTK
ncbi:MAG: GNAT family N-acetyltransferase [Erysipelothrix sp.]|nr:GNAT family N-acetyltransferase [Erysipelothrix sp.]